MANAVDFEPVKESERWPVTPKVKEYFASLEQSGDTEGDWLHLQEPTFQDLQNRKKIRDDITFEDIQEDPELYDEAAEGYINDLKDTHGIEDIKEAALWSYRPGYYKRYGGDIESIPDAKRGEAGRTAKEVMRQRKGWLERIDEFITPEAGASEVPFEPIRESGAEEFMPVRESQARGEALRTEIGVDFKPEAKTIPEKIAKFFQFEPSPADKMTDSDAIYTLSKMTQISPDVLQGMSLEDFSSLAGRKDMTAEERQMYMDSPKVLEEIAQSARIPRTVIADMDKAERRKLVERFGGVHADPTEMEHYRKLMGMTAVLFGGMEPLGLLKGLLKFQAIHTAISQGIKAYKKDPQLDKDMGVKGLWGLLDERDISDLSGPNATAEQKEFLQLLQFGVEVGLVGYMNKKTIIRIKNTMKGAGETVAKGGKRVVEGTKKVGKGFAEAAEIRAENEKILEGWIKEIEARGIKKADHRALINDAKAILKEKVQPGGEIVYDRVLVGEINKIRSAFQVDAKAPKKTEGADLRGEVLPGEHEAVRKSKLSSKEIGKRLAKGEAVESATKPAKAGPVTPKPTAPKRRAVTNITIEGKAGAWKVIDDATGEVMYRTAQLKDAKELAERHQVEKEEFEPVKEAEEEPEAKAPKKKTYKKGDVKKGDTVTDNTGNSFVVTDTNDSGVSGKGYARLPYRSIADVSKTLKAPTEKVKPEKKAKVKEEDSTLARKYTTEGETEKDVTELGNKRPEKNFKTDLQRYAKSLNSILKWEPEKDKKGKDVSVETNVAPAGGDGYILLWKPESEYGVYISVDVDIVSGSDDLKMSDSFMWRATTKADKWIGKSNQWAKSSIPASELAGEIEKEVARYEKGETEEKVTEVDSWKGYEYNRLTSKIKLLDGTEHDITLEDWENLKKSPVGFAERFVESGIKQDKITKLLKEKMDVPVEATTKEAAEKMRTAGDDIVKDFKSYIKKEGLAGMVVGADQYVSNLRQKARLTTIAGFESYLDLKNNKKIAQFLKDNGLSVRDFRDLMHDTPEYIPTQPKKKAEVKEKVPEELPKAPKDAILKEVKGEEDGKPEGTIQDRARKKEVRGEVSEGETLQDEPEDRRTAGGSPDIVRPGTRNTADTTGGEESDVKNIRLSTDKPIELTKTQRQSLNKQAKDILLKPIDEITDEEREILRQYTGAGGLQQAEEGVLNQHYTSYPIINFMWEKLQALGVKIEGATALEAAGGVGNFIGFKPEGIKTDVVEMDETASKIASILYPDENHFNMPFEKFNTGNFYDISIGNDPFGNFRGDIRYVAEAAEYAHIKQIHDFFILKRLDLLKPNGVLSVIVSTGTMDKIRPDAREEINKKAVFLGAYRLPLGVFKKNTQYEGSVDILFFRKRVVEEIKSGTKHLQPEFIKSSYVQLPGANGTMMSVHMSEYYQKNPDHIWGKAVVTGQYGGQVGAKTTKPIEAHIEKALKDKMEYTPAKSKYTKEQGGYREYEDTGKTTKSEDVVYGSFVGIDKDGELLIAGHTSAEGGRSVVKSGTKVSTKGTTKEKLDIAIDLMEKTEQFTREIRDKSTINKKLQAEIKRKAVAYARKYKKAIGYDVTVGKLKDDPRFFKLAGIMNSDGDIADILTKEKLEIGERKITPFKKGNLADAVRYTKETKHKYDTEEIARLMGADVEAIERRLVEEEGWNIIGDRVEPDAVYLYGDLLPKLDKATEQGLSNQAEKIIKALPEQATKETVVADPTYLWLPESVRDAWLADMGIGGKLRREVNPSNGVLEWTLTGGNAYGGNKELYINSNTAIVSIEKYLNHIRETDEVDTGGSQPTRIYSPEKTKKLEKVREIFEDWFKNKAIDDVTDTAIEQYNRHYNSYRRREPDSTPQDIEGISKKFKGKDLKVKGHQWEWVAQAEDMGKTINAHGVGGGKTMAAILLAQLSAQNNTAKRKMLLVPGKVLRKWASEIQELFPSAKVLSLENLSQSNAYKMLQQVAMNDFDFVLISTDRLKTIPIKNADKYLQEDIEAFNLRLRLLEEGKASRTKKKTERRLQEDLVKMKEKLASLQQMKRTNTIFFEDLNIDMLVVDEAHNYKNVYVDWGSWSSEQSIATQNNSERAADLWYKTRTMRDAGEGYIHFLTATPTPNNPIEIYAMLRYLAPEEWTSRGIMNAGDFVDQFCVVDNVGVPDVTGVMTTKQMIAGYKNLKALREIFKKYVDFRRFEDMADIDRPDAKYDVVEVPISKEQMKIGAKIVAEMNFAKSDPKAAQEQGISLLSLTTQSRQNAVGADVWNGHKYEKWESPNSKLAHIITKVKEMHKRSGGSGQLIFIDLFKGREPVSQEAKTMAKESGIPIKMADRTVYVNYHEKIRDQLAAQGIPKHKIAIVNGETNNTPKMKQKIMDEYNSGNLIIVIGTTKSMGEGMDLQADTVAIHNVDVPWTPDALTQRNGRGVRQGNKNDLVTIYNYVTKGSLDAFMYGKLHRKDKWNKELWLGSQDEMGNINLDQEQGLSYEELSQSLTIDVEELKFWEDVRQAEAMRSQLSRMESDIGKAENRVARVEDGINERKEKITEYEKEIIADPDKDTTYLTSRIEGHQEKVTEQEEVLKGVMDELNKLRSDADILKTELETINKAVADRGGELEDDMPLIDEPDIDDVVESETTQSVDDIIDSDTREMRGYDKGSISIPSGIDFSGFREGILKPWNRVMDWLWRYNKQKRYDPGLAEKFKITTEALSNRVHETIIQVNDLMKKHNLTIKERVKSTFAVEEKSYYDEAPEGIQDFADIFIDLFDYINEENKDRGIYKQSFLDRVTEETLDKKEKLLTKIERYEDLNSNYNQSYAKRQVRKLEAKLEKVQAELDQIKDLRFVSHSVIVQAVLDKKLSLMPEKQRKVWVSNARRLSYKYRHRKGIVPLRVYMEKGLLKATDLDLVKLAMHMLSEAQFRWTMKDLFDYAKESRYIVSARSVKRYPQSKNWTILNPLKHGIIAPEYRNYRMHPLLEEGLVELKATMSRKGGLVRAFYGIVKMGQFIKPMIIWKYDLLQAALGGALGVKTPYYAAKAIQLWTQARVLNNPGKEFREAQSLNIFQRAHIPVIGSKSEDEAISMAARRTLKDYSGIKKILEGLLDMPLTTRNCLNIIKVAYRALGNVTWSGDEIIRLSSYLAYVDMGYSPAKAAELTSQWHGAYADISSKARENLSLVFFVYAFRFLMPRQIFRLILEPVKMAVAGAGYAGGKMMGKPSEELPDLPEYPDLLRVVKGIAALLFLILGVDYYFNKKGFAREKNAQFWKWVKTVSKEGQEKQMVVALNLIYNQVPKQIYRALKYDPTNRLPRIFQGALALAKWELHPIYRIVGWDIAQNRKSIGYGPIYDPNAKPLAQTYQITKYFITESSRLLKIFEQEADVTEAYVLEEKDKQELWDATLAKHEQVLVDAFGYKYIARSRAESFDYAMYKVKREYNKRKRYARTEKESETLEEWHRYCIDYFEKLYGYGE